jgi:hypothetical protein
MNSVRVASMVARAAPLRLLVTLIPKKLKKAIDTTLPAVDHCNCLEAAISCTAMDTQLHANTIPAGQHRLQPHLQTTISTTGFGLCTHRDGLVDQLFWTIC